MHIFFGVLMKNKFKHRRRNPTHTTNRILKNEDGVTTTEFLMVISVMVIAVVAALWAFYPPFSDGVNSWAGKYEAALGDGQYPK